MNTRLVGAILSLIMFIGGISIIYVTSHDSTMVTNDDFDETYMTVTTLSDGEILSVDIVNSSNCRNFPQELYYRNGTIAGWLLNGTFTTEFPFDIWINCYWNNTVNDTINFKINSWNEVERS